jgi:beta-glucanase (GH16 family)
MRNKQSSFLKIKNLTHMKRSIITRTLRNATGIVLLLLSLPTVFNAQAQTNAGFPYQSIVRNSAGEPIAGQSATVRFRIVRTSADGDVVYSETHNTTTGANGMIALTIGTGTADGDQRFDAIDWSAADYYITTAINTGAGFLYTSAQQLLSVPYALHVDQADGIEKKSPDGTLWKLTGDNDGNLATQKVESTLIPIPDGYTRLVFNDEFNGQGLPDNTKWGYEEGFIRNGEKQYYTVGRLENCYQQDGALHIVCRNDSALIRNAILNLQWNDYWPIRRKDTIVAVTSASIHTKNTAAWTYCRVEVRAKLPLCKGTWPAIWMMPQTDTYGYWPSSGEIDIMEHVGYDPNKVYYTLHCQTYNSGTNPNPRSSSANCFNVNTEWHVFALEWHEDRFEWYLDGERKFRYKKQSGDDWRKWPFMHPFYLILNTGFGGGWGGREGIDLNGLPQDYVIDYVRVFQ